MSAIASRTGAPLRVEASRVVGAAAAKAYEVIADYRTSHTRIVPPKYFRNLKAVEGGYGAGTVITFDVVAFGKTNPSRARITEPDPGRELVETDDISGTVTRFIVEPRGDNQSQVTFITTMPMHAGLRGFIERALIKRFLKTVYAEELDRLDAVVTGRPLEN